MKKRYLVLIMLAAVFALSTSSCRVTRVNSNSKGQIPPGQMKKITGSKSAKQYAPGQQKNKNGHKDDGGTYTFDSK
ncbi:MAG: hypothetical protein ACD_77C00500G0005 [uncultured bacterium]|nr:MAG: hypothetical protein ACD_77C00500G0005 [uncultured bacterium]